MAENRNGNGLRHVDLIDVDDGNVLGLCFGFVVSEKEEQREPIRRIARGGNCIGSIRLRCCGKEPPILGQERGESRDE